MSEGNEGLGVKMIHHYGIYGVVQSNDPRGPKLLCVNKSRGAYRHLLDLPGGTPHSNEPPHETLSREIEEESGIRILRFTYLVDVRFEVFGKGGDPEVQLIHDAKLYRILAYDDSREHDGFAVHEDVCGHVWVPVKTTRTDCSPLAQYAFRYLMGRKQKYRQKCSWSPESRIAFH